MCHMTRGNEDRENRQSRFSQLFSKFTSGKSQKDGEEGGLEEIERPIPEVLYHGSKALLLFWDGKNRTVTAYLATRSGEPRLQNETTDIYRQAAQLCQEAATRIGQPITFLFRPVQNSKLEKWGIEKGKSVFGEWDSHVHDHIGGAIFTKIFHP